MKPQIFFNLQGTRFASCLWFDDIFPKKIRRILALILSIFLVFSLIVVFLSYSFLSIIIFHTDFTLVLSFIVKKLLAFTLLILSFRLIIFALESFYRSKSTRKFSIKDSSNVAEYLNFEAADLIFKTIYRRKFISGANILKTFSETESGKFAFLHLGVSAKDFRKSLEQIFPEKGERGDSSLSLENVFNRTQSKNREEIEVSDIISEILEEEKIFRIFFEMKIKKEDIVGVVEWASTVSGKLEKVSYWWPAEN